MKLETTHETLTVSDLAELTAAQAAALRESVKTALSPEHQCLDVDLSSTRFIDSSGLGALIALNKTMSAAGGRTRLLRPTPQVLQVLELTRLHRVFEIVSS